MPKKPKPKSVEGVGVVGPSGTAGGQEVNETTWTLYFSLQPWKGPEGDLVERVLYVEWKRLSERTLKKLMNAIKPYDILRIRVRLSKDGAELVKLLGKEKSDKDLRKRARELQKPVTINDPFFGWLTLNRAFDTYETNFIWNSQPIGLSFSRRDCVDEPEFFRRVRTLWKAPKKWDQRIRDFAAGELLALKNDTWLEENEAALTSKQFKSRMTLESISVDPDGRFEFFFNDGDLFWGHIIVVSGTLANGPTDADIAG